MGPTPPFRSVLLAALWLLAAPAIAVAACEIGAASPPISGAGAASLAIAEASRRFQAPIPLLRAVMHVESAGDARAVSSAGAIGLMQVTPTTFADLRAELGLGADPFNVRDNVLAGAAYLRQLFDRYGSPGFLAAYNAGPARWEAFRSGARPLPDETVRYLERLAALIDIGDISWIEMRRASPQEWGLLVRTRSSAGISARVGSPPLDGAGGAEWTANEQAGKRPIRRLFAAPGSPALNSDRAGLSFLTARRDTASLRAESRADALRSPLFAPPRDRRPAQ
ncbi:lytic transglycosylase domain-containing protein [Phenylobacterium montanum]|uniref:Lytic transglycosylase domain-containing protein n=1 Tax=Phenylobacterium montanum TaxID=2823693 RepID=A0A975IXA2_9CAUL|nr:lytic transglycosylase domain-containing protein [Caulobacter sp. S6]QUD90419.1 lytic transglycosylase domain-containing protein [Caulobacter sp. S6]